jgi:hypothetical protein
MAMGLYDPAFATLACLYGRAARGPITGITLVAGFASTVGWPLSGLLEVLRKLLFERIAVVSTQSSHTRPNHHTGDPVMAQMTPLRRCMIDNITVRNLSPANQQSYVYG